jgi:hypothetical protein
MIVLYPVVLAGALFLMWKSAERGLGARGWTWFGAWVGTGALFTSSFLTGFSIGLFLLPVAAIALFWLAVHAPHLREAAGFPLGSALVVLGAVLLI